LLTDYQVRISLDNTFDYANAASNGSDIRITAADGITEIPFWIEEWNAVGSTATIWVKVPSIPSEGTNIYLYYGSITATSLSNGTNTFNFFDDFSTYDISGQNWIRRLEYISSNWGPSYVAHDWKYSSEMQQGALYYAIERAQNGWNIESLDTQLEQEFNYIHSQINQTNGQVLSDPGGYLAAEPRYCYGLILSNLSLGYLYFETINPTLSIRCYNDMVLVFNYLRVTYPTVNTLSDAGGNGWLLVGYSNAWKALTDFGNTIGASQALTLVQNFASTFLGSQPGGSWTGANGIQEHLKRNFGMLKAYDVTGNSSYLTAVRDNIDYILATFWISSNGGLEWYSNPAASDHFYECHQMWFMIAVRMLYDKSGGTYNYLTQGEAAWHFLTDNNYTNIDMYVHNYVNRGAFFSYRQINSGGTIQVDSWKGSYEIGTALWGMALNYSFVSNYQSSHSTQAYNYLDMMVKQIKNTPTNKGYFSLGTFYPNSTLWSRTTNPSVSIIQDNGNYVASFTGTGTHDVYMNSVASSFNNFVLEMKVKMTVDANNNCTPEIGFRFTNVNNRYINMLRGEAINDLFIRRYQGGAQTNPTPYPTFNYTANQYYKYKITANGTTIGQYLGDNLIRSWNDVGSGITTGGITLTNYGGSPTNPVYYDDVRIRSYASVEPTTTVGSQETNPLPVELSSFSALLIGSSVKLNWTTETEVNNFGFDIERKIIDGQWEKTGFVNGNGNSNSPKTYSFIDPSPIGGNKFQYRLKQIDNDGQFEYTEAVEVMLLPIEYSLYQNYPNPFNPSTKIKFALPEAGKVVLKIYDMTGAEVAELVNTDYEAGYFDIELNASNLASGIYFYQLRSGDFVKTNKMILMK
jgi:Domain of unknown function (DUF2341)/Secretion system C-terminal sorting domain